MHFLWLIIKREICCPTCFSASVTQYKLPTSQKIVAVYVTCKFDNLFNKSTVESSHEPHFFGWEKWKTSKLHSRAREHFSHITTIKLLPSPYIQRTYTMPSLKFTRIQLPRKRKRSFVCRKKIFFLIIYAFSLCRRLRVCLVMWEKMLRSSLSLCQNKQKTELIMAQELNSAERCDEPGVWKKHKL